MKTKTFLKAKSWSLTWRALVIAALCTQAVHAQAQLSTPGSQAMTTQSPQLIYRNSIKLERDFYVARVAYSPDGRYLAIGDMASSNIIVWDVKEKREQARIHGRSIGRMPKTLPHWGLGGEIHWSPDGRYITDGLGLDRTEWDENFIKKIEFWDPMTGKVAYELPAIAVFGKVKFNRDGSKLLVVSGQFGDRYGFTVYDTRTWQGQKFDTGGVILNDITWTSDDKVFVIGGAVPPDFGDLHLDDGQVIASGSEVARVIDPTRKTAPREVVLEAPRKQGEGGFLSSVLLPDFPNHRVTAVGRDGSLMLIDTREMKKLYFIGPKDSKNGTDGHWGSALSSDGKYLFLLGFSRNDQSQNLIWDVQAGQTAGHFMTPNSWGLTTSPDGKTAAIGHKSEVLLYDIQLPTLTNSDTARK